MKRIRFILAIIAPMVMVALLSACSEKETDALTRVKKARKISFAMSGGYPPFNFYNDQNQLVGFDVDVAGEVAKRMSLEFIPITADWSGLIEGLRSGAYDCILGSMAVTEERLNVVDFSIPYYYSGAQLLVKKDSGYNSPEGLKGKVIGVVTGTTFEEDAKKLGVSEVRLYKDDTHTLNELGNGAVDGVITDRVVGVNAMNSGKFNITLLGKPLRSEDIAVAFKKGDNTLLAEVSRIITEMHQDGTLSLLSQKWLKTDITKQ